MIIIIKNRISIDLLLTTSIMEHFSFNDYRKIKINTNITKRKSKSSKNSNAKKQKVSTIYKMEN